MEIDYQEIINEIAKLVSVAGGIGVVFRVAGLIVGTFFDWAFPSRRRRGE